MIRVRHAWTRYAAAPEEAKSHAGARDVPIVRQLEQYLRAHAPFMRGVETDLLFATGSGRPFDPADVRDRARRAWKRAELAAITPHEARHTFASLMAAAGVPIEDLSRFMGHASIAITGIARPAWRGRNGAKPDLAHRSWRHALDAADLR